MTVWSKSRAWPLCLGTFRAKPVQIDVCGIAASQTQVPTYNEMNDPLRPAR
jgi:hypothetical protein